MIFIILTPFFSLLFRTSESPIKYSNVKRHDNKKVTKRESLLFRLPYLFTTYLFIIYLFITLIYSSLLIYLIFTKLFNPLFIESTCKITRKQNLLCVFLLSINYICSHYLIIRLLNVYLLCEYIFYLQLN